MRGGNSPLEELRILYAPNPLLILICFFAGTGAVVAGRACRMTTNKPLVALGYVWGLDMGARHIVTVPRTGSEAQAQVAGVSVAATKRTPKDGGHYRYQKSSVSRK